MCHLLQQLGYPDPALGEELVHMVSVLHVDEVAHHGGGFLGVAKVLDELGEGFAFGGDSH